jgi:hypothetical protein
MSGWNKQPHRVDSDDKQVQTETEIILTGLFTEVDSLRSELEGLRNDLSVLLEAASHEPARKAKAKAAAPNDQRLEAGEVGPRRLVRA